VTVTELLPLPGAGGRRSIHDINDRGQVVGTSGGEPVLWEAGRSVALWDEPDSAFIAEHINDRGDIVVEGYRQAYFLRDGQVTAMNPADDYRVDLVDLNESGQVLLDRTVFGGGGLVHRVQIWEDGTATDLRLPAAPAGMMLRLANFSEDGHVVVELGQMTSSGGIPIWRGTGGVRVWHAGAVTRLTSSEAVATGVNRSGQVIGYDPLGGVVWSGGRRTRLGFIPTDIDDHGRIIGNRTVGGQRWATLWDNGRVTDLGTLGGASSRALALNERGQVLGDSRAADGQNHAVLWTNGRMIDLGVLQALTPRPHDALNDKGQAIGEIGTSPEARPVMWTVHDAGEPPVLPAVPPAER
jgi:probable HAF family extracellular repeat protein